MTPNRLRKDTLMFKNRLVEDLSAHITAIIVQAALGFIWMKIGTKLQSSLYDKIEATYCGQNLLNEELEVKSRPVYIYSGLVFSLEKGAHSCLTSSSASCWRTQSASPWCSWGRSHAGMRRIRIGNWRCESCTLSTRWHSTTSLTAGRKLQRL